jgi:hypothetical protein
MIQQHAPKKKKEIEEELLEEDNSLSIDSEDDLDFDIDEEDYREYLDDLDMFSTGR